MRQKKCIAMLLAGGQGSRLGVLTRKAAKPAVFFGGKYRIIDFTLSNCVNSGIDTVGVLTQYKPLELNEYIGNGQPWGLDRNSGGVHILQPYAKTKTREWYKGTANAIYQNISFIEKFTPEDVLILSGDHIYKMDYADMIEKHKKADADCTIAVIDVPKEEASRFGIMSTDDNGVITDFEEKPKKPKSTNASMGVYVFKWEVLRDYLIKDEESTKSSHDFGKNIIPEMLLNGCKLIAHRFLGYWKDVGTVNSLWEANMDMIDDDMPLNPGEDYLRVYSRDYDSPPTYVSDSAKIFDSAITKGCEIMGEVRNSVISSRCIIEKGAKVTNSVIFPGVHIKRDAKISYSIVAEGAQIEENATVGACGSDEKAHKITVIGAGIKIASGETIEEGEMIEER